MNAYFILQNKAQQTEIYCRQLCGHPRFSCISFIHSVNIYSGQPCAETLARHWGSTADQIDTQVSGLTCWIDGGAIYWDKKL